MMQEKVPDVQQVALARAFLALIPVSEGGRAAEGDPSQPIVQGWIGEAIGRPQLSLEEALQWAQEVIWTARRRGDPEGDSHWDVLQKAARAALPPERKVPANEVYQLLRRVGLGEVVPRSERFWSRGEAAMDIGMIVIQVVDGRPVVVRCEEDGEGKRLMPAMNAAELAERAARVVVVHGTSLDWDGVYLCTDELQAAAQFPPLALPEDAISLREASALLLPDGTQKERWERLSALRKATALRIFRVGIAEEIRQYVSRAEVVRIAER